MVLCYIWNRDESIRVLRKKFHPTTCRFQRRFLIMIFSRPFRKIEMMVFALSCFLSTTTGKCIVEWALLWFEHNCDPLNRDCSKKKMDTMCWELAARIGIVGQRHNLKMIIQLLLICGTMGIDIMMIVLVLGLMLRKLEFSTFQDEHFNSYWGILLEIS